MDTIKRCVECGELFNTDNENYIVNANGDYVCEDCKDEFYFLCGDCDEWHHIDESVLVDDSYYVCESCADWGYYQCENCGGYYSRDYIVVTRDGDYICEDCAQRYYVYCDECGEYVSEDSYDYDYEMCDECANKRIIKPYHWHKGDAPTFFGDGKYFFGVEWELMLRHGYSDDHARELRDILGDRAYFEDDCTVDFECIFQPHTFEELVNSEEIKRAFEYAKEHMMNDDCEESGLHVHVSRTAFGDTEEEQDDNIAKLIVLHTKGYAYDMLKKLSRRTDHSARWARGFSKGENKDATLEYAKQYVKYRDNDHNVAINCGNRATVEFRLGAGTVDYDNFVAWVSIIKMLVEKCKTISLEDADNFYVWFEDADDTVKQYMAMHGVIWEEPIDITTDNYRIIIDRLCDKINENLRAQNMDALNHEVMLALIAGAGQQTRASLGYY